MNRPARVLFVFLLTCICFAAACGGGGGVSTPPLTPPPVSNPVPAVSTVTPASALAGSADTNVTIDGSGFIPSSTVQWNGKAIATTYGSGTSLSATIPAGSLVSGTIAQLTVVNPSPGGGSSATANFAVNNPVPSINAVSPASVVAGSGDVALDVTGTGFVVTTVISWNGTALSTTVVSTTELKSTVPMAELSGSAAIAVTVQSPAPGGGTSVPVTFDVNSPVPVIQSISPQAVVPGSAATVTITGLVLRQTQW